MDYYFEPVNKCIYCDAEANKSIKLTAEHIIPESLNGNLILPFSSCKICEEHTGGKVENHVTGQFLKKARVIGGFKSKRKRPKIVEMEILINSKYEKIDVPVSLATGILLMPIYAEPGIILNKEVKNIEFAGFDSILIQNQPSEFYRKYGSHGIKQQARLHSGMFMKMFAKIGLGLYVAEKKALPPDGAELIRDLIFGRNVNYSTYIGNTEQYKCERKHGSIHGYRILDFLENDEVVGSAVVVHFFMKFNSFINNNHCKFYIHIWGKHTK